MGATAGRFVRAVRGPDRPTHPSLVKEMMSPSNAMIPASRNTGRSRMENTMTVAEILDALYDGIGSTWVTGKSFVEEVGEWVDRLRETEADDDGDEP